jgi:hypothetical protein
MTLHSARCLRPMLALLVLILLAGCNNIPVNKREGVRQELIAQAENSLEQFKEEFPEIEADLANAEGYVIAWSDTASLVVARGVVGEALLVDLRKGDRTFLNITKLSIGPGIGAGDLEQLVVIHDRQFLEELKRGRWVSEADSWSSVGENRAVAYFDGKEVNRYTITKSGATLSAGAGLVRVNVNTQLTDTGLSDWAIPAARTAQDAEQADAPPKVWRYRLPFLAQKVLDYGVELPRPYGVGVAFADVSQDIVIEDLFVGFNGSEKENFEFVSFGESGTDIRSPQLKVDAWILPFVNVFGLLGKAKGDVAVDVLIDGNLMLDRIGSNCDRLIPPLECFILRDKNFTLPIRTDVNVTTYGVGTILAGGLGNWFGTVPMTVTWSSGNAEYDGRTINITPRFGRLFNIGKLGSMAAFVGATYMDSDVTVTGTYPVPGVDLGIDYTVSQTNADRWNYLVGFNWTLSSRVSWNLEYNGFAGSRKAVITGLTFRL